MSEKQPAQSQIGRRSSAWFAGSGKSGFLHRSGLKASGIPSRMFDGRPVIGICSTWSELAPCNAHLRDLADQVRQGVLEAGGLPLEFPVMSLGETLMRPTTMLFRNLASMDVEESIRANPLDAVVLLAGCDKTTPALLMGAASADIPAIMVSGGPTLTGRRDGVPLPCGTGTYRMYDQLRAGTISEAEFVDAEASMWRANGHCNTMGTASTMSILVEALGMSLPGNGAIPAVDARRRVLARDSGFLAVEMAKEERRPSDILTVSALENAIRVLAAIGGSTNAVIHLLAIAGRVGVPLVLDDFDRIGSSIPLLVDLVPSGAYLMEDFFEAGGLGAVLYELRHLLNLGAMTVTGGPIADAVPRSRTWSSPVVASLEAPLAKDAGIVVLRGSLAPNGAVLKPSAASPDLFVHEGRAVVFVDDDDLVARIDDPDLDVDESSVLVLLNAGPVGYPGMPELGNLPIPAKLLQQGVADMVRVSDARMSGTAFGTVVLHVSPESAVGGPLGLVRDGDLIRLDVPGRRLDLMVDETTLADRRRDSRPPSRSSAGYLALHQSHVLQADTGADLDFLVGRRPAGIPKESH